MPEIDISHHRLVDLMRLADQAEPFYLWVTQQFQQELTSTATLTEMLLSASEEQLISGINACYHAKEDLPILFDGIGRSYPHKKACYYFFAWLIRDAPQQRLSPLIQKIAKNTNLDRTLIEIKTLAALIYKYRVQVKTFSWEAIREVIVDRLEGSRRSLKGHEKEAIVRTALLIAIQSYYAVHNNYGIYVAVEIPDYQIRLKNETFDVSLNLLDEQKNPYDAF